MQLLRPYPLLPLQPPGGRKRQIRRKDPHIGAQLRDFERSSPYERGWSTGPAGSFHKDG